MTAHTPVIEGRRKWVTTDQVQKQVLAKVVTLSTDDTTTFSDVAAVASAIIVLLSDMSTIYTNTVATNVVTITEAAVSAEECLVIALEANA
jgi:hypothetical protein